MSTAKNAKVKVKYMNNKEKIEMVAIFLLRLVAHLFGMYSGVIVGVR